MKRRINKSSSIEYTQQMEGGRYSVATITGPDTGRASFMIHDNEKDRLLLHCSYASHAQAMFECSLKNSPPVAVTGQGSYRKKTC